MAEIQDFGNKIGGAKKDLWKLKGLTVNDILDMNDLEKNKYITKDNIWNKPDYQALVNEGISTRIAYFIKTIRDSLPTKPQSNSLEYQEGYISFISDIRDKTMGIKSEDEVLNYFENVMMNYVEKDRYSYRPLSSTYGCINNKVFKAAQVRSLQSLDKEINKKQFLFSDEEKILSKYSFFKYENITWTVDYNDRPRMELHHSYGTHYFYPQNEYSNESNWQENTYFIIDARHNIIANNLQTLEEAKQFVLDIDKPSDVTKNTTKRKTKFIPKQLKHIERVGENYRNLHNITGEDMLRVFGFYGGEFGNWLNENDKQQNLNYSYDAFVDLAKALNISDKDIALSGELSIAYGARGRAGAAAHYEPLRKVINLTKMSGAGSLAHEWGHALDHYLARNIIGGNEVFLTNSNNQLIKPLIDAMQYKMVYGEEAKEIHQQEYVSYKNRYIPLMKYYCGYNNLAEEQKKTIDVHIDNCLNNSINYEEYFASKTEGKYNWALEGLLDKIKQFTGHSLSKSERENVVSIQYHLTEILNKFDEPVKIETDYYQNSKAMDGVHSKEDKGYWASNVEMFARAFACYVKDKLSPNKNDYLCGHSESCFTIVSRDGRIRSGTLKAYPEGEERISINQCFDKLIEAIKERGLFAEYEQEKFIFSDKNIVINENKLFNNDFEQISLLDFEIEKNEPDICDNY